MHHFWIDNEAIINNEIEDEIMNTFYDKKMAYMVVLEAQKIVDIT